MQLFFFVFVFFFPASRGFIVLIHIFILENVQTFYSFTFGKHVGMKAYFMCGKFE